MQTDPRGPRFAAALTCAVLVLALATGSTLLLAAQAAVFGLAAYGGPRLSPYGLVFRALVLPHLGPPSTTEDERPLRFAQGIGLVFASIGVLGFLAHVEWLGLLTTSCALAAAFLNAAFGYCLGCALYPVVRRARGRLTPGV